MKTNLHTLCTALLLGSILFATAADKPAQPPQATIPSSPEFIRMKSLVGTWEGKVDMGQGLVDMQAKYRLLAGGTVLEERVFSGTPNEMITMYFEKDGKLALTHYCVMGNRPGMVLKSSNDKTLKFDFDKNCGINPAKSHMNSLTIRFDDADTITSACGAVIDGKEMAPHPTTMKRVKN